MIHQFLTFSLNEKLYAIDVFHVQEVLTYRDATKLPCTAPYIEGLINSRNQGITVVNFRKRFSLPDSAPSKFTRIIVLELPSKTADADGEQSSITLFGAVADSVNEVIDIEDEIIEPPPKFGNAISAEFISGICKKDDTFISILNIEKIFAEEIPVTVSEE